MKLIRVVAPHFVAGFESDGIVRRAAPILKYLLRKTDAQARAYIARKGWKASVVPDQMSLDLMLALRPHRPAAPPAANPATP